MGNCNKLKIIEIFLKYVEYINELLRFYIERLEIKQKQLRILFKKLNNINEIQNLHIFLVYKKIKMFHFLIKPIFSSKYQFY